MPLVIINLSTAEDAHIRAASQAFFVGDGIEPSTSTVPL
jgi:hypothetical protein